MIISTIKKQIIGSLNIAIFLVLGYVLYPAYLASFWGVATASLMVGAYLMFITYQRTKKQADQLIYAPSGQHKQSFEDEIKKCGLSPDRVSVRYSYADDSVALTMLNTVAVDHMLWKNIDDDAEAVKAKNVIETHIVPTLPASKKVLHGRINESLSCEAQRFIFKHELGHVFYNYSNKYIVLVGVIGTIAVGSALTVASLVFATLGGVAAVALGMAVGGTTDLLLTYASNVFFKMREEQKADSFAARYSTPDDIEAAAKFFAAYELHAQEYRESIGLPKELPTFLSGYVDGQRRAQSLRATVKKI